MKNQTQAALLEEVFQTTIRLLPEAIGRDLTLASRDPSELKKGGTDIHRMRILPRKKRPAQFWSSSWCFYEVGIGRYEPGSGEGLNLGGIQFFQNPNAQVCGKGKHSGGLIPILKCLAAIRPEFRFEVYGTGKIHLDRHYLAREHGTFPGGNSGSRPRVAD
jgi:hypothetical protein